MDIPTLTNGGIILVAGLIILVIVMALAADDGRF